MRPASAIIGWLLIAAIATAQGHECRGVNFPAHVSVDGLDLSLNGVGLQKATFLRIDVYVAALYVNTPSHNPGALVNSDGPQQLIVQFLRDVSVEDVRDQWTKDFHHAAPDRPVSLMRRVATLNGWLSDVKRNERLIFIRQPRVGIRVIVDGVLKGTIPGEDFARTFMSIWVGAAPPSPQLRQGLLGGECD